MSIRLLMLCLCAILVSNVATAQKERPAEGIKITVLDAAGTTLAQSITDKHGVPTLQIQFPKAALCNIVACCWEGPEFRSKRKLVETTQQNSASTSSGTSATTGNFTPIKVMCTVGGKTYTKKVSSPTEAASFQVKSDKGGNEPIVVKYQLDLTIQ